MPSPSARAVNAAQIRSAAYALRKSTVTGNNTWVTVHARQRACRGRSGPPSPSICRAGYPSRPAHRPHTSGSRSPGPPAATRPGQGQPLPSPSVSPSTTARHPQAGQDFSGVPRTHQFLVTLTVHTDKIKPATTPTATSAASMKKGHPVVVIQRDGQQPMPSPDLCSGSKSPAPQRRSARAARCQPSASANLGRCSPARGRGTRDDGR